VNAQDRVKQLRELIGEAGRNYYKRIALASALLSDKAWIEAEHGSDDYRAAEALEDHFFHDLSGSFSLWELLRIYQKFPDEAQWKAERYHLKNLLGRCVVKESRGPVRRVSIKEFDAVKDQAETAQAEIRHLKKQNTSKDETIASLQKRVDELEEENAILRGRVDELEKILGKKFKLQTA
jgi:predicted nuclease with TOPRIM domain